MKNQYFSSKKIWQAVNSYYTIKLSQRNENKMSTYVDKKEVKHDRLCGKSTHESER